MPRIAISSPQIEKMRELARASHDARLVRRANALLWLLDGVPVVEVADRLGKTRQTIRNWVVHFNGRRGQPLERRLSAGASPGRPRAGRDQSKEMIEAVIGAPPSRFGYAHTCWTASLIARHIKKETGTAPSTRTVRRALRELGYRYKRPRYTLARRARSWRQSKGGFSGG